MKSRWELMRSTTPSGRRLFVCTICGRRSIAPDKDCGSRVYYEDASGNVQQTSCSAVENNEVSAFKVWADWEV
jgi:hypothetical protein